ncbi:RNA-binding protein Y14 [Camellia lanceoleosa]|uniref:RNA-binding protein Y14 n=1 Tax=Camellia lanceoleosa TaxID=1840588 RepID=A0ACC0HTQ4_9ERIC|nr:RNA-binding protein Y14 [Camellia lanceoleosa]
MVNADVEAVDFELEDDDLMDEDSTLDVDAASPRAPLLKLKSAITGGSFAFAAATAPKKTKGRGFQEEFDADRNNRLAGRFDSLNSDGSPGPERCLFSLFPFLCSSVSAFLV